MPMNSSRKVAASKMQWKVSASVFLLVLAFGTPAVVNYCNFSDVDLCSITGFQHITCDATGDFMPSCPSDARVVPITDEYQKQIVDLHNKYRNQIASGQQEGFSAAAKMTTMVSCLLLLDI